MSILPQNQARWKRECAWMKIRKRQIYGLLDIGQVHSKDDCWQKCAKFIPSYGCKFYVYENRKLCKTFVKRIVHGDGTALTDIYHSNNTCIIWNKYQSLPQSAQNGKIHSQQVGLPEITNRYIPVQYNLNDTEVCMTAI